MGRLYIKEYTPPTQEPFITYANTQDWAEERLYDLETGICYVVFKEPEWLHFEEGKFYAFHFSYIDDSSSYRYRLFKRLNENTVIIHEDYGNGFLSIDRSFLGSAWKDIPSIEEWLKTEGGKYE